MRRSDSDISLTFAFCASLIVHGGIYLLALMLRTDELERDLMRPPQMAAHRAYRVGPIDLIGIGEIEESQGSILKPAPMLPPELADILKKEPERRMPELAPVPEFPDSEWGQKDGTGIAITPSPGKEPLQVKKKGGDDQSFASRDPEGPGPIPEEPSESLIVQGTGGDGRRPAREAMMGQGTQGMAAVMLGHPGGQAVPAPPVKPREASPDGSTVAGGAIAGAAPGMENVESMADARSVLPAEARSAVVAAIPAASEAGRGGAAASGEAEQLLPITRPEVIGIASRPENWWPGVVDALERPPGVRNVQGSRQTLPELAPVERMTSPELAPATVAMVWPRQEAEMQARRVRQVEDEQGATIVDALMHAPGERASAGLRGALPDLAPAAWPGGDEAQDAIVQAASGERKVEELIPVANGAPAGVAMSGATPGSPGGAGGIPGPPIPAADPAADTGFESDPFSTIPGVVFRNGKIEARSGRQVKPIRPRLTDAGRLDLMSLGFPSVVLKVRIDVTGKVTDVTLIRRAGSDAIDMPVYRCLWGWWFEPPKDKKGNAIPDVQLVEIKWG